MKRIFCLSLLACGIFRLYATTLVKDGVPGAVIVIPSKPSRWTQRAATDLQYHVEKASGARLRILSPHAAAKSKLDKIYIDKNDGFDLNSLGRNDFYIKNIGRDLVIAGKGEGASQGVHHLLGTKMNVRWLWPGKLGEVIPKAKTIRINGMDLKFKQPISSSRVHQSFTGKAGWQSESYAWRFLVADTKWLKRHGFSWDLSVRSQHSFAHPGWNYPKKYLKTHPEFFHMLPDGTRRADPYRADGHPIYIGTCPSSKTLLAQVLKDWKEKRTKGYPFGPNLFLGESDAPGACCCAQCLKADHSSDSNRLARAKVAFKAGIKNWTDELGDVTDRYVEFYLKALKEAKKTDPNVKVIGWAAYANFGGPPKYHTKLNKDIVVAFVSKLMYPWTQEKIDKFTKCWKGWGDTGVTMVLRPNFMLDGHNMPVNFARKFHALYQMCLKNGMIGTEFDSEIGQFGGNGFNYYVMARMTRSPQLSYDQILNEYSDAFGAAASDIKDYLNYWEKVSDSKETLDMAKKAVRNPIGAEVGGWSSFYMKAPLVYTPGVMAKGKSFLDKAAAKVKNNPVALKRVEFLQKGLKHAELTLEAQRAYDSKDKLSLAYAVQKLDKYRAGIEPDFVSNMSFLSRFENVCWDRNDLKFLLDDPGTLLTENWKFMFDPDKKGISRNFASDNFDTSKWYDIGIKKGWEKYSPGQDWKRKHGHDYNGVGWYRNTFEFNSKEKGRSVVLTFGAVDEACTVYINGQKVLKRSYPHKGDYDSWKTPFTVDITKAIRFDKPNTIAVRVVDTEGQGGIWKPVWIRIFKVLLKYDAEDGKNPFDRKVNISYRGKNGSKAYLAGSGRLISKGSFKIDPEKSYVTSVWVKTVGNKPSFAYLGIAPYDEQERFIQARYTSTISGSMTELTEMGKKGDSSIKVKDASKWQKHPYRAVAFNVKADNSDLPNRDVSDGIKSFGKKGGFWKVIFHKPLTRDYPLGTKVRQHAMGGYVYSKVGRVPTVWTRWKCKVKGAHLRRGITGRLLILANQGTAGQGKQMLFDDLMIEEVDN